MNLRRSACVLSCLLAVAACENNPAAPTTPPASTPAPSPAPAPAPSPAPTPAPALSTVTGTVTESEPTTSTRLDGVTVTLGDRTAITSGGTFSIANVPAGTYTLRASRAGYVEATRTITLPDDGASALRIGLDPNYESISKEFSSTISADDGPCPGAHGNYTCWAYAFPAHHARGVEANLYWHSSDARLELEFRCNGQTWVRTEGFEPKLVEFNREPYDTFRILEDAKKNQTCEIRVLHISGDPMSFIVNVTHPN